MFITTSKRWESFTKWESDGPNGKQELISHVFSKGGNYGNMVEKKRR